jgi:integrase
MDIMDAYRSELVLLQRKPHTLETYDRISTLFRERVGIPLTEVKRSDIQAFLLGTGWAPSTQRLALAWIRAAYNYAVDEMELLDRNPCRRVRLPTPPQKVPRTITNQALREMKAGVRTPAEHLLFCLFAYTGLRTIEVIRLTWNDVSLAENLLHIHGKRDKYRLVPIHPELRKVLVHATMISPWVVPGKDGPISSSALHKRMKRIADGRLVQNHDYRRSFATSLRANRVDPYVRDAMMGWSRTEQFAQAYNAVSVRELQDAILLAYADDPV